MPPPILNLMGRSFGRLAVIGGPVRDGSRRICWKIQRYLNMGRTEDEAAVVWGVGNTQLRNYLKLLDLDQEVQKAVLKRQLGVTEAHRDYAPLTREDQVKKLEGAALPPAQPSGKPKRRKAKQGGKPCAALVRKVANDGVTPAVREALLWALGDTSSEQIGGKLKAAVSKAGKGASS